MSYLDHDFPSTRFYESDLREMLKDIKSLLERTDALESWKSAHEKEYEELKEIVDNIVNGIFPNKMYGELRRWFTDNAFSLVGNMVKFITVGINDNGYIYFQYPEQWNVIKFNTTQLDISTPLEQEYGHLTISY